MASAESYVKLAQSLPPRLLRFFSRYPPRLNSNPEKIPSSDPALNTSAPTFLAHNNEQISSHQVLEPSSLPNPFKCHKHPATGKWHDPVFSLRRQADLVKLARTHGVEELLPFTVKGTNYRIQKRAEQGLRVKGTGVMQKVKGHKWERMMRGKMIGRKEAMLAMPQMIHDWKKVNSSETVSILTWLIRYTARAWPWMEEVAQIISTQWCYRKIKGSLIQVCGIAVAAW